VAISNLKQNEVEKILAYYKKGMPFSDVADTSVMILEKYAEHADFLRQKVKWCQELPEDIFLENVAAYRINNEKIVDCRRWFYDMVYESIQNKKLAEAIMEVNMWCAKSASYHLADERTANAAAVYKSGYGRCGEESVFAVTVLRSVGIAARQVYAPYWSHCDDNHAWVEVWCDGTWQYLGACEPEAFLNQGWFDVPASRAMLVHASVFGTTKSPDAISREGCITYVNVTQHYAETVLLELHVMAEQKVLKNMPIQLEVLNYSSYEPIANLKTDEDGIVRFRLGLGDVRVSCAYDRQYRYSIMKVEKEGPLTIIMELPVWEVYQEYVFISPAAGTISDKSSQKVLLQNVESRLELAKESRQQRLASYFDAKRAAKFREAETLLKNAAGNFEQVITFLKKDENPYRLELLKLLTEKDMYDLEAEILEEHLVYGMEYKERYAEDIWLKYVLNPRIEYEELSCYRREIRSFFTEEEKRLFRREPVHIWNKVCIKMQEAAEDDYRSLRISPVGAIRHGKVNEVSRKILFTAVCRSLGIASRLHPVTGEPQYYTEGEFVNCKRANENSLLHIMFEPNVDWQYQTLWSLSKFQKDKWSLQDLAHMPIQDGQMQLHVEAGFWRFITTFRTADGNQLVREYLVRIAVGERKEVHLQRHSMVEKQIEKAVILPEVVICKQGKKVRINELCNEKKGIFIWLDEGKEPSEHILYEMLERIDKVRELKQQIFIIAKEPMKTGGTMEKMFRQLQGHQLYTSDDWTALSELARVMEVEADKYPLAIVCSEDGKGIRATSGYHVGAVSLLFEKMSESSKTKESRNSRTL